MALTAEKPAVTVTCEHDHVLAVIEPDGTVMVRGRDGCEVRIPPKTIVIQQRVVAS